MSETQPEKLYVIGDIHGRLDLLEKMIDAIARDVGAQARNSVTVTVGDYVDRGPDTRGVIDRLVHNPFPTRYVALKGNHEDLLLKFLRDPQIGEHWRRLGGPDTLHSYGVSVDRMMLGRDYAGTAADFAAALPEEHARFFAGLKTSVSFPQHFVCHAGIRPGVPFEQQSDEDLMWIRREFLDSDMDFGKRVIHGHTPVEAPEVKPNRINVDTGAFATNRLTCVALEGGGHRFITA
jgi:serine/threonine protein phosphatase 1